MSRPPFTSQLDMHPRDVRAESGRTKLGRLAATPQAIEGAIEPARRPSTHRTTGCPRQRLAKLAVASGRPKTALEHLRVVVKLLPRDPGVNLDLGKPQAVADGSTRLSTVIARC